MTSIFHTNKIIMKVNDLPSIQSNATHRIMESNHSLDITKCFYVLFNINWRTVSRAHYLLKSTGILATKRRRHAPQHCSPLWTTNVPFVSCHRKKWTRNALNKMATVRNSYQRRINWRTDLFIIPLFADVISFLYI